MAAPALLAFLGPMLGSIFSSAAAPAAASATAGSGGLAGMGAVGGSLGGMAGGVGHTAVGSAVPVGTAAAAPSQGQVLAGMSNQGGVGTPPISPGPGTPPAAVAGGGGNDIRRVVTGAIDGYLAENKQRRALEDLEEMINARLAAQTSGRGAHLNVPRPATAQNIINRVGSQQGSVNIPGVSG